MKTTGILRSMDDLGRIVIPREIRRSLHLAAGDAFEIFIDGDMIAFQKYIPNYTSEISSLTTRIKGEGEE